jgi:hypothetical protein
LVTAIPSFNVTPRRKLVMAVEAAPAFPHALEQFADYCGRGPVVLAALRSDRVVAPGSESAFNGIGSSQVLPVLGREVVERQ